MLSNPISSPPPSALQTRQRLHRRQRSTPAAFETKMPAGNLPAPATARNTAAAIAAATAAAQTHTPSQQPRQQPLSRQSSHRRGQSLDNRRQQLQQRHERQQQQQQQRLMAAAVASSSGSLEQDLQNLHDMREMQQQCTERPGSTRNTQPFARQSRERQTQQQQPDQRQEQDEPNATFDFFHEPTAATMRKSLSGSGYPTKQQDFQLFGSSDLNGFQTSHTTPQDSDNAAAFAAGAPSPGWQSEEETSSTRRATRRVSNGIMDRVARFEGLAVDNMPRPTTPPRQDNNAYFAPTPRATPQDRLATFERKTQLTRFSDDFDESMEETLKPQRNRSNRSSGIFEDMRQQAESAAAMATPPRANMLQMPMTPTDFMNMSQVSTDFLNLHNSNFAAMSMPAGMQHLSPPLSQQSTPATVQDMFDGSALGSSTFTDHAGLFNKARYAAQQTMSPIDDAFHHSPSFSDNLGAFDHRSSHRRNESMDSMASTASMASSVSVSSLADMNLDESRTETGVTLDDIATYIEGPSPIDRKWRCCYEGCNKRFGRKENIKSHVQTHLNDRQYQCPHCQKCFVRQHDLKRHAKIHTGVKPYPCECGNSFARHDALTRHRQRGMCIGAFDGAVRKVGKRGRPRKNRPDLEARREKSSRTRSKNQASSSASPRDWQLSSSPEAYLHSDNGSDSSASNSPRSDHSGHLYESEPFHGVGGSGVLDLGFGMASAMAAAAAAAQGAANSSGTMNPSALVVSSAPMPGVPPSVHASPLVPSPSALSQFTSPHVLSSSTGDEGTDDFLPTQYAASPVKSEGSHYSPHHPSTPPELSASSSPPQSSARFFDMDPYASYDEDDSLDLSAPLSSSRCGPLGGGGLVDTSGGLSSSGSSLDDDMLLMKALSTEDVLAQLDNSGLSMLNTSRFDDDYALFTNSDDLLFGS